MTVSTNEHCPHVKYIKVNGLVVERSFTSMISDELDKTPNVSLALATFSRSPHAPRADLVRERHAIAHRYNSGWIRNN